MRLATARAPSVRGYARLGQVFRKTIDSMFKGEAPAPAVAEARPVEAAAHAQTAGLTPPQWAFAHRIGIAALSQPALSSALSHPSLSASADKSAHQALVSTGRLVLDFFVAEYVSGRFPRLPRDSRSLARTVYSCPQNLAVVARSIGLEFTLVDFEGLPHVQMPSVAQQLAKAKATDISPTALLAETLLAVLGQIAKQEHGMALARRFLDAYIFSTTFPTTRLVSPRFPILRLQQSLDAQSLPAPSFRLLHESGRTSASSMFVVGVFSGEEMLAEGYGASINLAEHRAATEALRKLYLVEVHDAPRPSDKLQDDPAAIALEDLTRNAAL